MTVSPRNSAALSSFQLKDRVAVVTGAAGGIGSAIADVLAALGARVALVDLPQTMPQLQRRTGELGHAALAIACDIVVPDSVAEAADAVQRQLGMCDVLVNNAGFQGPLTAMQNESLATWDTALSVNVRGALLCTRAFGAQMLSRGSGNIVNIGSIAGHKPNATVSYSVSKAALLALTRHTAVEWGPRGIRTNAVSPGFVMTRLSAMHYTNAELTRRREQMVPLRRLGEPEEIARAVAFLASDASSFVNGHDLIVDGGFLETTVMHAQAPEQQYGGFAGLGVA